MDMFSQDKELFLASFVNAHRYHQKNHSEFIATFLVYSIAAQQQGFPAYWHKIVQHCSTFGCFVPPLHTLHHNLPMGIWYPEVPSWVCQDAECTFASLLSTALLYKKTGLSSHHELGPLLLMTTDNGYWLLYHLAEHFDHPKLLEVPPELCEPQQTDDMSLDEHVAAWSLYVHEKALHRTVLSDWYFVLHLAQTMHAFAPS